MNNHRPGRQAGDGQQTSADRTLHYAALMILVLIVVALIAVMR